MAIEISLTKLPWYALRQNYSESVVRAGGLPALLPHEPEQADAYLEKIDGLIITGGAFDVDPAMFGATSRHGAKKPRADGLIRECCMMGPETSSG